MQVNMLTLKELSSKNFDMARFLQNLRSRRDAMLNLVIIVGTLFAMNLIFSNQKERAKNLSAQLFALDEKVKEIAALEETEREFQRFVKALPQGLTEPDVIIDKVNAFAIAYGIQIPTIGPATRENSDIFTKTSLHLTLQTSSYQNLGLFIKDIEKSEYNVRIDRWQATSTSKETAFRRSSPQPMSDALQQINVEMDIVSIAYKK